MSSKLVPPARGDKLGEILERLVRMESRLVQVMNHLGIEPRAGRGERPQLTKSQEK